MGGDAVPLFSGSSMSNTLLEKDPSQAKCFKWHNYIGICLFDRFSSNGNNQNTIPHRRDKNL
jgi:hypothetical protein